MSEQWAWNMEESIRLAFSLMPSMLIVLSCSFPYLLAYMTVSVERNNKTYAYMSRSPEDEETDNL